MASPFPGMDPYLEAPAVWEEFHHVLITECMYWLSERLPDTYVAKIQERVELISVDDEAAKVYVPDVAVARRPRRDPRPPPAGSSTGGATATLEPVTIPAVDTLETREGYIEIRRLPDHQLVTSIEVLSPWNKFGEGVGEYRAKRRATVSGGVHVVELDLLRRGARTELSAPLPAGDYYALVFRADRRPDVDVYPWGLRDRLPVVPIPLRAPDPDVALDLASIVSTAYERGRYARKLGYADAPPGPTAPDDLSWIGERLADAGRR